MTSRKALIKTERPIVANAIKNIILPDLVRYSYQIKLQVEPNLNNPTYNRLPGLTVDNLIKQFVIGDISIRDTTKDILKREGKSDLNIITNIFNFLFFDIDKIKADIDKRIQHAKDIYEISDSKNEIFGEYVNKWAMRLVLPDNYTLFLPWSDRLINTSKITVQDLYLFFEEYIIDRFNFKKEYRKNRFRLPKVPPGRFDSEKTLGLETPPKHQNRIILRRLVPLNFHSKYLKKGNVIYSFNTWSTVVTQPTE